MRFPKVVFGEGAVLDDEQSMLGAQCRIGGEEGGPRGEEGHGIVAYVGGGGRGALSFVLQVFVMIFVGVGRRLVSRSFLANGSAGIVGFEFGQSRRDFSACGLESISSEELKCVRCILSGVVRISSNDLEKGLGMIRRTHLMFDDFGPGQFQGGGSIVLVGVVRPVIALKDFWLERQARFGEYEISTYFVVCYAVEGRLFGGCDGFAGHGVHNILGCGC